MTLKAICPECGMSADMAAFVVQGEHNQALAAALEIPAPLGARLIRYLGLFRPANRSLATAKAVRLLTELRDVIASGRIERKGITRPASLGVWISALDQLLERPPSSLPLKGHGYLFEIVAAVADKAEADAERKREEAARSGAKQSANTVPGVVRERSTADVLAEHRRMAARGSQTAPRTQSTQHSQEQKPSAPGIKRLGDLLQNAPSNPSGEERES